MAQRGHRAVRPAKWSCNYYNVNIAGGFDASQLTSNYTEANGTLLPTKLRATKTARTTTARISPTCTCLPAAAGRKFPAVIASKEQKRGYHFD